MVKTPFPPFIHYLLFTFSPSHAISVRPHIGGSPGIQGHRRYVAGNWVYVEMTHPFFLAAVLGHRLGSGLVLVQF